MIYGLILAGGIGSRMGAEIPKQFIEINGKPIIAYTIDVFVEHPGMEAVIILVPEDWVEYTRELVGENFRNTKNIYVVSGGELRNDTIMKGIEFIESKFKVDDETIVLTHDAVRPFITTEIIDNNIEAMKYYSVCDTVIPATDTIVHSANHKTITNIPDRAELYQGQTPQTFKMVKFKELYQSLSDEEKRILTDAAKVFVIRGEAVGLVEGAASNIKITYPSDIIMAKAILGARELEA